MLMGLAVSALVINWAMISWSHLRFRAHKQQAGQFPSPAYPIANYLCLAFVAGILVIMYLTPDLRLSVYMVPAWLAVLGVGYWSSQRGAGADGAVVRTDSPK
jgi:aromatic amino acid transport protein AroP